MTTQPQVNDVVKSSANGNSWWLGILGVIELFLGFIALASPWLVGASFIWVIGIMLMVLGVVRLVQTFTVANSRGWSLVTAILYGLAGWFLYQDPNVSLAITTLIIGWGLTIAAIFKGAIWLQTRALPASGWRLFNVLITLALGLMVIFGWPESTAWFIGTLIAVELIFSGWTLLLYAFGGTPNRN